MILFEPNYKSIYRVCCLLGLGWVGVPRASQGRVLAPPDLRTPGVARRRRASLSPPVTDHPGPSFIMFECCQCLNFHFRHTGRSNFTNGMSGANVTLLNPTPALCSPPDPLRLLSGYTFIGPSSRLTFYAKSFMCHYKIISSNIRPNKNLFISTKLYIQRAYCGSCQILNLRFIVPFWSFPYDVVSA